MQSADSGGDVAGPGPSGCQAARRAPSIWSRSAMKRVSCNSPSLGGRKRSGIGCLRSSPWCPSPPAVDADELKGMALGRLSSVLKGMALGRLSSVHLGAAAIALAFAGAGQLGRRRRSACSRHRRSENSGAQEQTATGLGARDRPPEASARPRSDSAWSTSRSSRHYTGPACTLRTRSAQYCPTASSPSGSLDQSRSGGAIR